MDARGGGEEFVIFVRPGEDDARFGERAAGGVEQDAGDGDVGAEGDAGEDEDFADGTRVAFEALGAADALVAVTKVIGVELAGDAGDHLRKQIGVNVAEARLEEIGEALGDDAKKKMAISA